MRPIVKAKFWCDDNNADFEDEIWTHLAMGWVYSGDDAFVIATEEQHDDLLGFGLNKDLDTDTWFVYLYAGDLRRVLELIPHQKEWVAFRRDNGPIKFYKMEKLLNRIRRS